MTWIEHPAERDEMGQMYADSAREYDIRKSTEAMVGMYRKALFMENLWKY